MRTALFLLAAVGQAYFLWTAIVLYRAQRDRYLPIVILTLLALVYDGLTIAIGGMIGEGPLLRALNTPRFLAHALITPLLLIFVFGVMRRCGVSWAQSRGAHATACLVAVALVLWGSKSGVLDLSLAPRFDHETIRYANTAEKGPPIPVILVSVLTTAAAIAVGRKTRQYGMLAGSLVMFALAPQTPRFPAIGNIAEVFFSYGLISGERAARRIVLSSGQSAKPA